MGRKPIRTDLKRDTRLVVLLRQSEMDTLESTAQRSNAESLSAWVRSILLKAAENTEISADTV